MLRVLVLFLGFIEAGGAGVGVTGAALRVFERHTLGERAGPARHTGLDSVTIRAINPV